MPKLSTYALATFDPATDRVAGVDGAGAVKLFRNLGRVRSTFFGTVTIYVRPDGNDSNDGTTNDAAGAFLTIQAAVFYAAANYDLSFSTLIIQCAAGTYVENVELATPVGSIESSGFISPGVTYFGCVLRGDPTTPGNVIINGYVRCTGPNCQWYVDGFKFINSGGETCLWGHAGGWLRVGSVEIGATTGFQVTADYRGTVEFQEDYTISAGAQCHYVCNFGGFIMGLFNITVTLTGTPAFSLAFTYAAINSFQLFQEVTFSGAATGKRYWMRSNSTVDTTDLDTFLSGGPNFFPGSIAGTTETGGQYI